jgi:hypothetical protein
MAGEKGTVPCASCGTPVETDWGVCPRCGTPRRPGGLAEIDTSPGAPLIRAPKRLRISGHDYVPTGLRQEYERTQLEREQRRAAEVKFRQTKTLYAAIAGLALVAFPYAVPAFVFLPSRKDAIALLGLDALVGVTAGALLSLAKGGWFQACLIFGAAFVAAITLLVKRDFPVTDNPAAFATVAATALLSIVVAGVLGAAIDEHVDQGINY